MTHLLADTHVHLYEMYDANRFLDAAVSNLRSLGEGVGSSSAQCLLCMVDLPGQDAVARLKDEASYWEVEMADSGRAVATRASGGETLHVLPGHQLVSTEDLEVLALDCRFTPPTEQMPLLELISLVREAGGVPVLPWGVGKWTGTRARILQPLLGQASEVLFADSGNRLQGSPIPASLQYALDHGRCPVAGSDPLPLESHESRAGCYATHWAVEEEGDAADLLRSCLTQPKAGTWEGTLTSMVQFVKDQAVMQRNKRAPWLKWSAGKSS